MELGPRQVAPGSPPARHEGHLGRLPLDVAVGGGGVAVGKTLVYRLFGLGGIPQAANDQTYKKSVVLKDESISRPV